MNTSENLTIVSKSLTVYADSDYITQLRAKFIYYLCLALTCGILILIITNLLAHPLGIPHPSHLSVLFPLVILLILMLSCLWFLIKGYYNVSANLLPLLVMSGTWVVMFLEKDTLIIRLDTIVNIFSALSMIPLLTGKKKYSLLLYPVINIIILFIFISFVKTEYGLSNNEIWDYLIDVSIAIAFVGFVGYYNYSINKNALEIAESELKERKAAESALVKSERKYKDLADLLPQMVCEIDLKGNITYVNQSGLEEFGYSEDDFRIGINIYSLLLEKEKIVTYIDKVIKGQRTGNQYTAIRKNGKTFPVQIFSNTILENGKPVGLRGIIINISDRVQAENALLASERKFREMALLLPQTVYESDLIGILTYINKAGTDMFGYSDEDVKNGLNVLDTIFEEDHEKLKENIQNVITGEVTHSSRYTGRRKDGSNFPIQIYSSVIIEGGVPVGFRGIIYDISDIAKAQDELKKSNELFKTLIDFTPAAITLTDLNGRFIHANNAFYKELGITAEKVIGKNSEEIGIKINSENEKIIRNQLIREGAVENFETTIYDQNGKRYDLYIFANIVEINNQKVILRTNINVTDKKKLENQLKEYSHNLESLVKERTDELASTNEELQATNDELYRQREQLESTLARLKETQEHLIQTEKMASLGILTAGVAHEINNPINYIYNGIMAVESYIEEQCHNHMDELKPFIDAINTGINRTKSIVKSLNKYSHNNSTILTKCNIHEIIDNCLSMLYNQYKNRINIVKDFTEELPEIMANEGTLHQAFLNILTNASQSINEKGDISIQTVVIKNKIEIHFTDTGEGISEENIKYIYDPFFTTKDPGQGTGLGLSITQRIIREHGGSIQCKSQKNTGTEFIVNLPINQ